MSAVFRITLCRLILACVSIPLAVEAQTDRAPTSGRAADEDLVVRVGDYQLAFCERKGWTMLSLSFQGNLLFGSTGANQAVVHIKPPYEKEGDHWIGTAHGREAVDSVVLRLDGRDVARSAWMELAPGNEMVFEKRSRLGPIGQLSRTRLTADGLEETVTLTALDDGDVANFLYVFMHCWAPAMSQWQARGPGGILTDRFYQDDRRALMQDIRWLALLAAEKNYGAVIAYPTTYKGVIGYSNILWNRVRDNKHYLKVDPPRGKGTQITYECRVVGYTAPSASEWARWAMHKADALAGSFSRTPAAATPRPKD